MLLKIGVRGSNGAFTRARLFLDFHNQEAIISAAADWHRTGMAIKGTFWRSPSTGVVYIENQDTARFGDGHGIKLFNAPWFANDTANVCGRGEMRSGNSTDFSNARIEWRVPGLTALRQEILNVVQGLGLTSNPADKSNFPNGPPSDALKKAVADLYRKQNPGKEPPVYKGKTTNCGELPGYVLERVGGDKPADMTVGIKVNGQQFAAKPSLTQWKEYAEALEVARGSRGAIWHPFRYGCGFPLPGDIYVLRKSSGGSDFGHVGIVIDASTPVWKTADSGQGDGFGSCYQPRAFNSQTGTMTLLGMGSSRFQPDAGTRYLWGWVDVDALFQREMI